MNEFSFLNDRNRTEEQHVETPRLAPQQSIEPVIESVNRQQIAPEATNQSAQTIDVSESDFEQDLAVSDRRQRFASEILRFSLIGIAVVGFLLLNFLFGASDKAPEAFAVAKKTLANSDFRFYVFAAFYLFAFSAGIALLQRYFASDANAYHLKYLRLRDRYAGGAAQNTQNVSHLIPHSRRGFFDGFWLYLFGAETDELQQQTENEKDARDFLFKTSNVLLFLSGLLFWIGVLSLVLSFGVVLRQFGT